MKHGPPAAEHGILRIGATLYGLGFSVNMNIQKKLRRRNEEQRSRRAPAIRLRGSRAPMVVADDADNLRITKDIPGLVYFLQGRTNLVEGAWEDVSGPVVGTGTSWSAELPKEAESGFYRVRVAPPEGSSPPWPQ